MIINNIENVDCESYLLSLPDNSIDCVITDPPYFIDKMGANEKWDYNDNNPNSHIKHLKKGMKFTRKQTDDLLEYYTKISKIVFNKLKPGGFFLSFSSPRLYHSIAMAKHNSGFEIRDTINWIYTKSMPKAMAMDHVIKNNKHLSNEQKINTLNKYKNFKTPQLKSCTEPVCVAMKPISESNFIENELIHNNGLVDFSNKVGVNNDKVPSNIITTELNETEPYNQNFLINKPDKYEKEDNDHPTVKPLKLISHLIKLFTKENSIICDPFMGSGTTAIASKLTNRNFIGSEINKHYFDICIKRLNKISS